MYLNTYKMVGGDYSEDSGSNTIEIGDVENYRSDKFQVYSHQVLVMEVMRKVTEAGSHEMREGWINEKTDRDGNVNRVYVESTKKKLVETIKTAMMIMACDYDKKAKDFINECLEELDDEKQKLLDGQYNFFLALSPKNKIQNAVRFVKGAFNMEMGWYVAFTELEVECYRAIGEALHSLTKRIDFYQTEDFEA